MIMTPVFRIYKALSKQGLDEALTIERWRG